VSKIVSFVAVLGSLAASAGAQCLIPSDRIVSGGPGKDGIPALTSPDVVPASVADAFLMPDALVLGVTVNGESRAYPHNVLWWHEIVNDVVGGRPLTVSFCPLTGSGMVWDADDPSGSQSFGVSGLLFDNNLILYDRGTDSLWSQMRVEGICGALSGTRPALLPVVQSTWAAWKSLHPDTTVVSFDTGHRRDYTRYPYGSYDQIGDDQLLFPNSVVDRRRPLKEVVLGLVHDGVTRAYPYGALGGRSVVNDVLADRPVVVVFDAGARMALAFDRRLGEQTLSFVLEASAGAFPFAIRDIETGSVWDLTGTAVAGPLTGTRLPQVATFSAMWFAWAAFHPETEIWQPPASSP
jgi:hypothetical protein